jgi:hypothetical protein
MGKGKAGNRLGMEEGGRRGEGDERKGIEEIERERKGNEMRERGEDIVT